MRSMFGSLRVRNYRLFAIGQLIKLIGTWMLFTAQDWLVLQLSHNSPTALGIVSSLQFLPVLLFSLWGGQLADRFDKRKILLISNAGSAIVAGVLGGLTVSGVVALWHVFVTAALFGMIQSLENPARQSFFSELVGPELLPNGLSLSAATFNGARTVGPAIAGVLIAAIGTGPVFLLTAAMCVAPLVFFSMINAAELHREGRPGAASAQQTRVSDGVRYVWGRFDIALIIGLVAVVGMFGFNFQITLAALAKNTFHTDAKYFGLLTTSLAFGALFGALTASRRRARPSVYLVVLAAALFGALETVVAFAPSLFTAVLLLLPTGYFMVYFAQTANQRVQLGIDAAFRGRVMAIYVLVFLGTTPIGAPIIGWLSERFGSRAGIWIGGLVTLGAGLVVAVLQVRRAHGRVRVHLRPTPHLHVFEPARDDAPALELRMPPVRQAA
jgi:MFS family permease